MLFGDQCFGRTVSSDRSFRTLAQTVTQQSSSLKIARKARTFSDSVITSQQSKTERFSTVGTAAQRFRNTFGGRRTNDGNLQQWFPCNVHTVLRTSHSCSDAASAGAELDSRRASSEELSRRSEQHCRSVRLRVSEHLYQVCRCFWYAKHEDS